MNTLYSFALCSRAKIRPNKLQLILFYRKKQIQYVLNISSAISINKTNRYMYIFALITLVKMNIRSVSKKLLSHEKCLKI